MSVFYALPTSESMNPLHPQGAAYYDPRGVAYVLFKTSEVRTRPTRVYTSSGLIPDVKVGTVMSLKHDQTNAQLGDYKVVGIHHFATGEMAGSVPDMKLKHCVAK